ncbi:MAG: c-type cytochrome [Candidatus Tectomicrobia bacterium]|uniref:C-type cytochrome n=1 Tax=Tectimicrobiota bacterium TaxID=2528274 RepID=A0A932HYZ3_UNCTE|nr:c-type cytochrome [Candidatus Tectomicrobia bacterium]
MNAKNRLRWTLMFIILLASVPSASLAAGPAAVLPDNPVGGSMVFVEKRCILCHSIQGYGGTRGPDLGRLQLSGGFLAMAGIMWNHAPKMISALAQENMSFPQFSTLEMSQLVAFLYTLNYLDPPGDAREGEEAFAAKRCVSCHSVGGAGGKVGPALDQYGRFASPVFVATALWNKGIPMSEAMERERILRPTLSGRDVRNIVEFIQARSRIFPAPEVLLPVFVRPGNPREGASLFVSKQCVNCHAADEMKPGIGPALAARKLKVSLSTIAGRMWNHSPEMWAVWKKKGMSPISFTVDEMADVTAFLYFLQFQSPQGDPARGAAVFAEQGCAGCHSAEGSRKPMAPDLRAKGPWASDIDLAREMWNHAGNMYGTLLGSAREWPKLTERHVADLLAYVRSIGGTHRAKK